jgi:hypothetical protein
MKALASTSPRSDLGQANSQQFFPGRTVSQSSRLFLYFDNFYLENPCLNVWYKFERIKLNGEDKKYMIGKIRRLVLDVLKPMDPTIIEMAEVISRNDGVSAVNISMVEIDLKVENAKITIEGDNIIYEQIVGLIEDMGGSIHSIDEVVAGKMIIDDAATLQD